MSAIGRMRSCFAGRTALQHTHNFHRRAVVQATLAELKPSKSSQCRRGATLTASSATVSAPERVREETASSSASKEAAFALLDRAVSVSDAEQPNSASIASSSKRETLESPEQLASTPEHRTLVGSAILLLAAIGAQGVSGIHSLHAAAQAFAAVSAGYVLAGMPNTVTPLLTRQRAATACGAAIITTMPLISLVCSTVLKFLVCLVLSACSMHEWLVVFTTTLSMTDCRLWHWRLSLVRRQLWQWSNSHRW